MAVLFTIATVVFLCFSMPSYAIACAILAGVYMLGEIVKGIILLIRK